MDLLVTLNAAYIPVLRVMLCSLLAADPAEQYDLYFIHSGLTEQQLASVTQGFGGGRLRLHPIAVSDGSLAGARVEKRYPREMYYRLFAASLLPAQVSRILYLDPDLVALRPLKPLYELPLGGAWFAGASHVHRALQAFNDLRLDTVGEGSSYINSGVLLMDIEQLRLHQDPEKILAFIKKSRAVMLLPDQDVLNSLYADRIRTIDPMIYNLSDRVLALHNLDPAAAPADLGWVRENTVIVHYCGRNKPWKREYIGVLDVFYRQYEAKLAEMTGRCEAPATAREE